MKSKISYQKNDKVLVKSFAGPDTRVILRKRYIASQSELKLGVDGWEAQITIQKEVYFILLKERLPMTANKLSLEIIRSLSALAKDILALKSKLRD